MGYTGPAPVLEFDPTENCPAPFPFALSANPQLHSQFDLHSLNTARLFPLLKRDTKVQGTLLEAPKQFSSPHSSEMLKTIWRPPKALSVLAHSLEREVER